MSARILLVTGSRALEGSAQQPAAYSLLVAFIRSFTPTIVVCGDATGPDSWTTLYVANDRTIGLRIYSLDGWVYSGSMARHRRWHLDDKSEPKPLDRNIAMVSETAEQRAKGAHVEVVGLAALWSTTKGTAHTLGKARAAGLAITRITFERSDGR